MKNKVDVLLVSFDKFSNDVPFMIVGRKNEGEIADAINAFQGDEALELYNKLVTQKGE